MSHDTVRCKFQCVERVQRVSWTKEFPFHYAYVFQAVTSGSPENKAFFAATPSGKLEVSTVAVDTFEVGKEYYLDLALAQSVEVIHAA